MFLHLELKSYLQLKTFEKPSCYDVVGNCPNMKNYYYQELSQVSSRKII